MIALSTHMKTPINCSAKKLESPETRARRSGPWHRHVGRPSAHVVRLMARHGSSPIGTRDTGMAVPSSQTGAPGGNIAQVPVITSRHAQTSGPGYALSPLGYTGDASDAQWHVDAGPGDDRIACRSTGPTSRVYAMLHVPVWLPHEDETLTLYATILKNGALRAHPRT